MAGGVVNIGDARAATTGSATETTLALIKAKTDNIDVALSTRTKPADIQKVDGSAVTQPVSGPLTDTQLRASAVPVTANAGTNLNTSALALDATLTGRTQKSQITDGTRDGTVKAASTLPLATDTALVVTQRDGLPTGSNTIGKADQGAGGASAWKVDGSAVTQPVSLTGTVTVAGQAIASATVTNVAASATNVTLKASNASRKGLYIYNFGTSTLFVKLGATATTTTSFTFAIVPNGFWELPDDPIYTGIVDGIWTATGGNGALVTEL